MKDPNHVLSSNGHGNRICRSCFVVAAFAASFTSHSRSLRIVCDGVLSTRDKKGSERRAEMGGGRLPATAKHRSVVSPAMIIAIAFAAAALVVAAFAGLPETRQQVNIVCVCVQRDIKKGSERSEDGYQRR